MPLLITASTEEVEMDVRPEDGANARSDEPEARSGARWRAPATEGGVAELATAVGGAAALSAPALPSFAGGDGSDDQRRADYFARNVRTREVLLDRDAITNGQAGNGNPFEFYDLGHGYCSYTFFEQCTHRMACARCDFYLFKPSSQAQLLEAKDGLQRMLVAIPLTDDERAAVETDQAAVGRLIDLLADTPTPAGPTPLQITQTAPSPSAPRNRTAEASAHSTAAATGKTDVHVPGQETDRSQ
jgi:hypothetical protein